MTFGTQAVLKLRSDDAAVLPLAELAAVCDFIVAVPDQLLRLCLEEAGLRDTPARLRQLARRWRRQRGC